MKARYFALISLGVLCSACALLGPRQFYSGETLPEDKVAIVSSAREATVVFFGMKKEGKLIKTEKLGTMRNGQTAALLPGDYKAIVTWSKVKKTKNYDYLTKKESTITTTTHSKNGLAIKFTLAAGNRYRLRIKHLPSEKWRAELESSRTGKIVSSGAKLDA